MNQYRLLGKAIGQTSSCGDQDVVTLFDESFYAVDDDDATKKANKVVQRLEGEILRRSDKDDEIQIEMSVTRHVKSFRFVPSAPAQPAVEAQPARPACLK